MGWNEYTVILSPTRFNIIWERLNCQNPNFIQKANRNLHYGTAMHTRFHPKRWNKISYTSLFPTDANSKTHRPHLNYNQQENFNAEVCNFIIAQKSKRWRCLNRKKLYQARRSPFCAISCKQCHRYVQIDPSVKFYIYNGVITVKANIIHALSATLCKTCRWIDCPATWQIKSEETFEKHWDTLKQEYTNM